MIGRVSRIILRVKIYIIFPQMVGKRHWNPLLH